jgi:SAM-dependent methyltransferase
MDRQKISSIAHTDHPIAAPLSDESVRTLLARALPHDEARILDLGCGSGAWLTRALALRPGLHAEGVDLADPGPLDDRIVLHAQDAREFTSPHRYDLVLSIGASHAFDGLLPTLAAARSHLAPGGSVLLGDCFWEHEPDQTILDAGFSADDYDSLATTVDRITADGWTPVYGHVSTPQEWDDYEWSWTGSLSRWALDHPEHPDSGEALRAAAGHRTAWLRGYRGTLGFVTLLLRPTV